MQEIANVVPPLKVEEDLEQEKDCLKEDISLFYRSKNEVKEKIEGNKLLSYSIAAPQERNIDLSKFQRKVGLRVWRKMQRLPMGTDFMTGIRDSKDFIEEERARDEEIKKAKERIGRGITERLDGSGGGTPMSDAEVKKICSMYREIVRLVHEDGFISDSALWDAYQSDKEIQKQAKEIIAGARKAKIYLSMDDMTYWLGQAKRVRFDLAERSSPDDAGESRRTLESLETEVKNLRALHAHLRAELDGYLKDPYANFDLHDPTTYARLRERLEAGVARNRHKTERLLAHIGKRYGEEARKQLSFFLENELEGTAKWGT